MFYMHYTGNENKPFNKTSNTYDYAWRLYKLIAVEVVCIRLKLGIKYHSNGSFRAHFYLFYYIDIVFIRIFYCELIWKYLFYFMWHRIDMIEIM